MQRWSLSSCEISVLAYIDRFPMWESDIHHADTRASWVSFGISDLQKNRRFDGAVHRLWVICTAAHLEQKQNLLLPQFLTSTLAFDIMHSPKDAHLHPCYWLDKMFIYIYPVGIKRKIQVQLIVSWVNLVLLNNFTKKNISVSVCCKMAVQQSVWV